MILVIRSYNIPSEVYVFKCTDVISVNKVYC